MIWLGLGIGLVVGLILGAGGMLFGMMMFDDWAHQSVERS